MDVLIKISTSLTIGES